SPVSSAEIQVQPWKPLFKGIDCLHLHRETPEALCAYAVRIDLNDPDIRFFVTPQNGDRDKETDGLEATTFLKKYGCQIAVNATPYSPDGEIEGEPRDVLGLAISEGDLYSNAHGEWGALLITKDNRARIETPPFKTDGVYNAIGGYHLLLKDGENVASDDEKHPRTAVGLSKNKRFLYLMVVDGRQSEHSLGASTTQTAELLKSLGAHDALNLDGGGSTVMVVDQGNGEAKTINRPIHRHLPGTERVTANHLGVFAKPLPQE
ncbi:MAG: phosphodiester glycosidase family protein, partial [Candidatus Hydrogenedentes bacterium]|nr:phosphodiester glycosidase family protein [Candidatus Hydrogenedentota bacterium]